MAWDFGITFMSGRFRVHQTWFFLQEKQSYSCMGVSGTTMRSATLQEPRNLGSTFVKKLDPNKLRDREHLKQLLELGWRVLVVWECQLKDIERVSHKIREFLTNQTGGIHR